jgi:hypothetical protein
MLPGSLRADGPADNIASKVRPIPPVGILVPEETRASLKEGLDKLETEIVALRDLLQKKPDLLSLMPDVEVFHKAVRYALDYGEFFHTNELKGAAQLLRQGMERAEDLRAGRSPWIDATGLVVRGYRSKIDGSIQPYGLVVPDSYQPDTAHRFRLDVWFHGRGERLSEVAFLLGRQRSPGQFTPANTIVVHPYGRYCNGSRFAGETDLFEVMDQVREYYPIDENRQVVRGFSLGGASCWHFAVHHPGMWAAAAPGAGFSETEDFLTFFQKETLNPTWYERKLWHWYDATDYALNLFHCPTVAYSGEVDRQRQAAQRMSEAMAEQGLDMVHVIGPEMGHRYHPDSIREINHRIDQVAAQGRNPLPHQVKFTTWTLRYNNMQWVTIDALQRHWERALVTATIKKDSLVKVDTENVTALTLHMDSGLCPWDMTGVPVVELDGRKLKAPKVKSDRSWTAHFRREGRRWRVVEDGETGSTLVKRHGLQGPIDDAFMDSFLVVRPTGQPMNQRVGSWVESEMKRFIREWRRHYRGDVMIKNDSDVTEQDMASHNVVVWGDPKSNLLLKNIASGLPIRWTGEQVRTPDANYPADRYVPVMVYPNPLNPDRYVVINSGFTFREYDYLNNARQTPKLPDYAIVDLNEPPGTRWPGGIATAGFFGEQWEWIGPPPQR